MSEDLRTDTVIAGGGVPGILLASELAKAGVEVVLLEQGPHFREPDRAGMLLESKRTLNDFADYNDKVGPGVVTALTSAAPSNGTVEWMNHRLFGIGGTALHFEGIMIRPREEDLRVRSLYGYARDWPMSYSDLEPWLLRAEQEIGVAGGDDNPYTSARSDAYPMPAHPLSYYDKEIFGPALKQLGITGHSCPIALITRIWNQEPT
jgi:choline dehydrogenase-like flavoprotein